MNEQSKETDKSNNESEYILFHFKNNNFFKNSIQNSTKKNINNSNNNNKNNSPIIVEKTNINFNKEKSLKSPFTNLILREKIESDKVNNFFNKGEKLKLKLNDGKRISTNNSTKNFLIINRFETIVSKDSKIKENNNFDNKTLYKEKNNNNKIQKNYINNGISQKTKRVSTGQQTFIDMNYIDNNNRNIEVKFNYKSKKNEIINIPIKNKLTKNNSNNNRNINIKLKSNFENNNNSSLIYIPIPQIKLNNEEKEKKENNKENNKENKNNNENKKEIKNNKIINNFINLEHLNNYSKGNFDSLSINELNYVSVYDPNYKKNRTQRLIKNRSNIVSFDDVQLNEKKNPMSIRELYRQMISAKEKEDKKKRFILKKKKIKNFLKKKNEQIKNKYKIFNSNLISLEQYTLDRINKKKSLNNKIKIKDCKRKIIINNKNSSYYINNLKLNTIKKTKKELNENIFTNILRSLSLENNKINNPKFNSKNNNKRSQINILTMIELNDKKKHIIKKYN